MGFGVCAQRVINFEYLVSCGLVDSAEVEKVFFTDEVEEAFNYLKQQITSGRLLLGDAHVHKSMRGRSSSSCSSSSRGPAAPGLPAAAKPQ